MKHILVPLLLMVSSAGLSQSKQYLYHFDKNLNTTSADSAVFYGTGEYEDSLFMLMLYSRNDKHLIMIEHFTDSSLQMNEGLLSSYYNKGSKETEGNYEKGKQGGWWVTWDSTGNVIDSVLYSNGEINTSITYGHFADKNVRIVQVKSSAHHKGSITTYNEDGSISSVDSTIIKNDDAVVTKVDKEASFPGGDEAWISYITKKIQALADELTAFDYGTCNVRFIVSKDGKVTHVEAVNMKGTNLARIAVQAIKNGPNWVPARQNGRNVNAYRIQPVEVDKPN